MKLKKVVKFTNGVRHQINIQKNSLIKLNFLSKKITKKKKSFAGRNLTGRITVRHKGGGHKKRYYYFSSNVKTNFGIILGVGYNAVTNSFISLSFDLKKKKFFKSTTIKNAYTGCLVKDSFTSNNLKTGCKYFLKNLPIGCIINSISTKKLNKEIYSKSAGTFSQILEKKKSLIKVRLPSGYIVSFSKKSEAFIGSIANSIYKRTQIGKAGRNRLKGKKPSVRGIAMNPVDHPHGGRSNKGMPQVTPWGIPTKNKKTVTKHNYE